MVPDRADRRPLIIAHRGGHPAEVENSAAAFTHALQLGVDMLECDVRRTADGVLVLIHDAAGRIDDQTIRVRDTDYAALRETYPWILSLAGFLDRFGGVLLNVDLKATGFERQVAQDLTRFHALDRTIVSATHLRSLLRLRRVAPRLRRGLSHGQMASSAPPGIPRALAVRWLRLTLPWLLLLELWLARADAAMLQHWVVTPGLVTRLHRHGYRVFVWTVDDPAEAARLTRAGVDAIASNDPAGIMAAMRGTAGEGAGSMQERLGGGEDVDVNSRADKAKHPHER